MCFGFSGVSRKFLIISQSLTGHTSCQDEHGSGGPIKVSTTEIRWTSCNRMHSKNCYTSHIDGHFDHEKSVRTIFQIEQNLSRRNILIGYLDATKFHHTNAQKSVPKWLTKLWYSRERPKCRNCMWETYTTVLHLLLLIFTEKCCTKVKL